jgi:small basic protein
MMEQFELNTWNPLRTRRRDLDMWLPLLGLIIGVVLGLLSEIRIPDEYSNYLSIAVLASLDTLFGGIRAHLQNLYDEKVFVSGFFFNIILAASLAFLGVHLGVDLYLAAVFAFGVRLFQNIAVIRRILISKWSVSKEKAEKN